MKKDDMKLTKEQNGCVGRLEVSKRGRSNVIIAMSKKNIIHILIWLDLHPDRLC